MMRSVVKFSMLGLLAVAVAALPMQLVAQTTNSTPPPKKMGGHPFHGKLAAVDAAAKTITVGESTYEITSTTRISKDDKPGTLEDGVVGEEVTGFARDQDGKKVATRVYFGKHGKKAAPPTVGTNSPATK